MKKRIQTIILLLTLLLTANTYAQNSWTISPNPAFSADFTSLHDACESSQVQAGDLLYVHGGNYGNDTISKEVGVVGTGYFLGMNGEASFQANNNSAIFQDIYIAPSGGSSFITGLQMKNLDIDAVSVFVSRCYMSEDVRLREESNYINVEQCYISKIFENYSTNNITLNLKNSVVGHENNYSFRAIYTYSQNKVSGSIQNCIFYGRNISFWDTASCLNNIFLLSNGYSFYDDESSFSHNLWVGSYSPSVAYDGVANNQVNIDYNSLFVGTTGNSTDGQWQLSENSPAKGAGVGGTDCGIFGGDNPYVLSGLPGIPNIYQLSTPSTATGGGGLNVQVKAKSNQ